jgi:hypothetical protein
MSPPSSGPKNAPGKKPAGSKWEALLLYPKRYVGRLKSNAHMLVEREQKQIARSVKKYMKVQFLSFKSIYLFST